MAHSFETKSGQSYQFNSDMSGCIQIIKDIPSISIGSIHDIRELIEYIDKEYLADDPAEPCEQHTKYNIDSDNDLLYIFAKCAGKELRNVERVLSGDNAYTSEIRAYLKDKDCSELSNYIVCRFMDICRETCQKLLVLQSEYKEVKEKIDIIREDTERQCNRKIQNIVKGKEESIGMNIIYTGDE